MKKFRLLTLFMAFSMIFCFYGMAFAGGGGPEDPECPETIEKLPLPDAGKFLRGNFTVARDKGECSIEHPTIYGHYNVHVMLKWGNQEHLYSFQAETLDNLNLCDLTSTDLMKTFGLAPCGLSVQNDFDLSGIGVITDMEITQQDFCADGSNDEMIRGEIVIRVVPPAPVEEEPASE